MIPTHPPRRRLRAALAMSLAAALAVTPAGAPMVAAAQGLPDLGDVAQAGLSPAQERKIGEETLRQIRSQGGYLNDPEVNDYLNELGQRLVAASNDTKQEFEFFAVPDPAINAFALPGGFIGVHTGLILLAQSESELASVLAHEITHVTQHHIARMIAGQQNTMLMSLAALAVALVAARSNSSSGGQAASAAIASAQALAIQSQLNFTREHEYEADRIGFQRLDAAGFDVTGAATFMERLQRSSRFADVGGAPSYLRTHPITYDRIAEAQARAHTRPYRQVADSLDFHMVRALLKSYIGSPQEAVKSAELSIRERKYNNEIAAHYGLVASLLRAGDLKRAKAELASLEKIAPPHPMVEAIGAHVLMESGELDAALRRYEGALARYPNKMQLVYDYPDTLIKAGRAADAAAFTERQIQRFPDDGPLHQTAAKAYAAQNRGLKQHYHQGEYYAWQGNLRGAIDQFEIAIKSADANFYESSVVETRLRSLRKEMAERQKEGFGRAG